MKEKYFSTDTINQKSKEMLSEVYAERLKHELDFHIKTSALLVLDMQEYFLNNSSHAFIPSGEAIIPKIHELITSFVSYSRPIIFTRHINSEGDAGMMKRWWKHLIHLEDPKHNIISAIRNPLARVIDKAQYDAFFRTNLEEILKIEAVEKLVITGVMTHLCCETTARSAFMRGYEVFFVIDGTATYNETFHRATLLNLAHGFAFPILTEELKAKMA
jgi:bifunctional isochorismate lyase/aryl carrier protein